MRVRPACFGSRREIKNTTIDDVHRLVQPMGVRATQSNSTHFLAGGADAFIPCFIFPFSCKIPSICSVTSM